MLQARHRKRREMLEDAGERKAGEGKREGSLKLLVNAYPPE